MRLQSYGHLTPSPTMTIGLVMETIIAIAKTILLTIDIGLRIGLAVLLLLAWPFLYALMQAYQEYPLWACLSAITAAWLFLRIIVPRRYQ